MNRRRVEYGALSIGLLVVAVGGVLSRSQSDRIGPLEVVGSAQTEMPGSQQKAPVESMPGHVPGPPAVPMPPLPPLVPENATVLGQGKAARPWAVSAYVRDGKPTLEVRFRAESDASGQYEIIGKSDFRIPDSGVIDQLGTVDGDKRLVFGVVTRNVATVRLELSDGSVVDVAPQRQGMVASWRFDTYFVELPVNPELKWVAALDETGQVLERVEPHERRSEIRGRSSPR